MTVTTHQDRTATNAAGLAECWEETVGSEGISSDTASDREEEILRELFAEEEEAGEGGGHQQADWGWSERWRATWDKDGGSECWRTTWDKHDWSNGTWMEDGGDGEPLEISSV